MDQVVRRATPTDISALDELEAEARHAVLFTRGGQRWCEVVPARTGRWLEGDTVIVNFAHVGSPPSAAGEAREAARLDVEDIVAIGQARSLYRLAPSDSLAELGVDPPAVHYVVGSQIRIKMVNRQVQGMEVAGQTQGVHLEPMQRRPQADTLLVRSHQFPLSDHVHDRRKKIKTDGRCRTDCPR